jgi:hypothetical protein
MKKVQRSDRALVTKPVETTRDASVTVVMNELRPRG